MHARSANDPVGTVALAPKVPVQRPRESLSSSGVDRKAADAGGAGVAGRNIVIPLRGDVDLNTALRTGERIGAALEAGPASVDVNLESVTSIDTCLLNVLSTWRQRCDAAGSLLLVTCSSEPTKGLFSLAGMDNVLTPTSAWSPA